MKFLLNILFSLLCLSLIQAKNGIYLSNERESLSGEYPITENWPQSSLNEISHGHHEPDQFVHVCKLSEDRTMLCSDGYKIKQCISESDTEEIDGDCNYTIDDDVTKNGKCIPAVLSDKISWRYKMPRVIYHCID